ncbi:insulinase family protein [Candidatus Microgenomates bacterium]|nr:insulinase family protein [Candidatus Microgenomates bacterium]
MIYSKYILPNGLRLITVPLPSVASATVMILVGVGSRYEDERVNGVTHFLEHMVFKGTKKRPSAEQLSEMIDMIGGEWNASTGKESTAYYIKAAATHLPTMFDILSDLVTQPLLEPAEIEREKGVIISEIAMYEDTPSRRVGELFETLLYPGSPLGWDIAGKPETVMGIKREDFTALYRNFYHPENMVVAVAGNVKEHEVKKLAQEYLGKLKACLRRQANGKSGKAVKETFIQEEPRLYVYEKKTDQAHLVLGVRGNPRGHEERWAEEMLSSILCGGKSSRLWVQVREKRGLAYHVESSIEHYRDNGYFAIYAGVQPEKVEQTLEVILGELRDLRQGKRGKKVTARELRKAKEFVKGHLALGLEDTRNVASFFGAFELLEGKVVTPTEVQKKIDAVTVRDIMEVVDAFFNAERLNLALISPYNDGEKFKRLLVI